MISQRPNGRPSSSSSNFGGQATAAQLAERAGIEDTAAGNRLVNLVKKGYLYRFERTRREGNLFVDPRCVDSEP